MVNVTLIGCGRIGERHLESLSTLDNKFNIQVYDKFIKKESKMFVNKIEDLNDNIDICLIATKADVRKSLVEDILEKKNVKYLILEKVAFQSIKDFEDVINLVNEKNVTCYVNCPLRLQPLYKKVNEFLNLETPTKFTYEYSEDFKISSSFIHILDLFYWFCKDSDIYICSNLKEVMESIKHKGFVDFKGEILVTNSNGHTLHLTQGKNKFTEILKVKNNDIEIYSSEGGIENGINDNRVGEIIINNQDRYEIPFLWQSYLTAEYVKQIVNDGKCELPTLEESFKSHKPMIESFNEFLSNEKGRVITTCPIT